MATGNLIIFSFLLCLQACCSYQAMYLFDSKAVTRLTFGPSMEHKPVVNVNFKNVKALIFDIDGTIADSGQLGFEATNVVLKNNGLPTITEQDYLFGCRYTTPVRLARHAGLNEDNIEFEAVGKRLGKEFDDYYISLVSMETAPFFRGILELLENLPSDVIVGALTNAAGRYAHAVLKANSIAAAGAGNSVFHVAEGTGSLYSRFQAVFGADEVPKPKPYSDGLLKVCEVLRVSPSDCVYVGDAPSDGMAAKAAGMGAIGVVWGANSVETLRASNAFDYICHSVQELRNLVPQRETCQY